MGLTIHYGLSSKTRSADRAKALVEQIRQLALDLPFERVDEVRYLGPDVCQTPLEELRGTDGFDVVCFGSQHVDIPWSRKRRASISVQPLEIHYFDTVPGPGSEWATFGLARYPAEIEMDYSPEDDDQFIRTITRNGGTRWEFDYRKWECWLNENGHQRWLSPTDSRFQVKRKIKTRLAGWRGGGFCKTQYASDPNCGGVPNFVRCHLCVIHLLDRIAKLPTMKVYVNDEGKYGRSYYTDDPWAEKRVYTWHDGKYDVKALIQEIGEWNEMIAAAFGGLKDMAEAKGMGLEGSITAFPNFEQLEFKGQKTQKYLGPFLDAMRQLAEKQKVERSE
jgi:hypothetical protein